MMLAAAQAADLEDGIPSDQPSIPLAAPLWSLKILPYVWLPYLVGDVTVRGRSVHLDVNPIQVLEHLTTSGGRIPAWMSYVEARRGALSLYNDTFYTNLGLSGDLARTRPGVTYAGMVGYRALDVDYEHGSGRRKYGYDVLQHGPMLGLAIRF
jgi:hypothetical protein